VIGYYLDCLHRLGAELSISTELAEATWEVEKLAEASGDRGLARIDEPYRRAITGIYARLAATMKRSSAILPQGARRSGPSPMPSPARCARISSRSPMRSPRVGAERWRGAAGSDG